MSPWMARTVSLHAPPMKTVSSISKLELDLLALRQESADEATGFDWSMMVH